MKRSNFFRSRRILTSVAAAVFALLVAVGCQQGEQTNNRSEGTSGADDIDALNIRNGDEARAQLPQYNAVGVLHGSIALGTFTCTATLITPSVILTAAHCVSDSSTDADIKGPLLAPSQLRFARDTTSSFQEIAAVRVIRHPGYLPPGLYSLPVPTVDDPANSGGGDVALVKLASPFYNLNFPDLWDGSADMNGNERLVTNQTTLTGIGFGQDETNTAGVKRTGTLQYKRRHSGFELMEPERLVFEAFDAILRFEPGKANQLACHGDSGGPVYDDNATSPTMFGTVSSGNPTQNCNAVTFNRYMSMEVYGPWIDGELQALDPQADALRITPNTLAPAAGSCVALTINSVDNIASRVLAQSTTVSLTGTPSAPFYSNSTCTTPLASNKVAMAAGESAKTVYFKVGAVAGTSQEIRAADINVRVSRRLKMASATFHLKAGTPTKVLFTRHDSVPLVGQRTPIIAGRCESFDVKLVDHLNNVVTLGAPKTGSAAITPSGNAAFYASKAMCDAKRPTTSFTFAAGVASTTIFAMPTKAGNITLTIKSIPTGSGTNFPDATVLAVVRPDVPSQFKMTGNASAALNSCSPYAITVLDKFNNAAVIPAGAAPVTFKVTSSNVGKLFTSPKCTGTAASSLTTTIAAGGSTSIVTLKRTSKSVGSLTVSDGSAGLADFKFPLVAIP